jgi:hypothetical protein
VPKVFHRSGACERELSSLIVASACLLFSGHAQDSADAYIHVVELARELGNTRLLAGALQNGGAALVDLRQLDRAERFYGEALVLYDELRVPTEKARSMWALGAVVVARGHLEEGASRLDSRRTELAGIGLTHDAAQATLEWAEDRLALQTPKGVAEACRKIVVVFNSEGMQRHAKEALAVLREALAADRATPELLRSVRLYLEQLPANPSRRFVRAL